QLRPQEGAAQGGLRSEPLLPEKLDRFVRSQPFRDDDRVSHDIPPVDPVDDLVDRRRAVESVFARLKRSAAAIDPKVNLSEEGIRHDALPSQASEDLGSRGSDRKEKSDRGTLRTRRVPKAVKQEKQGDAREQREQEKQADGPTDRAQRGLPDFSAR